MRFCKTLLGQNFYEYLLSLLVWSKGSTFEKAWFELV